MANSDKKIDRYELVKRNSPSLTASDTASPFTVGNGEFAFTADITGLQTFNEDYQYFPLCTMSQWGWHSFPADMDYSKLRLKQYDTYGRMVGYASDDSGQEELFKNLRENPHRLNLGRIGMNFSKEGEKAELTDIYNVKQELKLWSGLLCSEFSVFEAEVRVQTCCDPELDAISACVRSPLISAGILEISISFPYGSPGKDASDWNKEEAHTTEIVCEDTGFVTIKRVLDNDIYYVNVLFGAGTIFEQKGRHQFIIRSLGDSDEISFTCRFLRYVSVPAEYQSKACTVSNDKKNVSGDMPYEANYMPCGTSDNPHQFSDKPYGFNVTKQRSSAHWERFWSTGGAIQLVNSKDSRARELERRIILSQYLTAVQCSGSMPPAETGLACNSWYGKFHLEMHFWHAAWFALWGRTELLERSLGWYAKILPKARDAASRQGYKGARWPKMCDPDGNDSPSSIGVFLVWQQPHPIMYAELCYRAHPVKDTLEKYREIVVETAGFMASYAHYDEGRDRYVLGPPIIPVQETHAPEDCMNPAFELEYFRWGLKKANDWLVRLGEAPNEHFAEVEQKLSSLPLISRLLRPEGVPVHASLPVRDGGYIAQENCPETFTKAPFNHDHPSMLAAFGVLPGESVDRNVMENTLKKVLECWSFDSMWGWDFAVMAMCCARLGLPSLAVDMLLTDKPKNTYAVNGHNSQADREDLPLYLPGNGGLLLAAAMMAVGWDGSAGIEQLGRTVTGRCFDACSPGFPSDGTWVVEAEGLMKYI